MDGRARGGATSGGNDARTVPATGVISTPIREQESRRRWLSHVSSPLPAGTARPFPSYRLTPRPARGPTCGFPAKCPWFRGGAAFTMRNHESSPNRVHPDLFGLSPAPGLFISADESNSRRVRRYASFEEPVGISGSPISLRDLFCSASSSASERLASLRRWSISTGSGGNRHEPSALAGADVFSGRLAGSIGFIKLMVWEGGAS